MVHDRGTPDDHTDDIVANLDQISFNNDTFELSTDGPVVLVSMDMQMTARKMRVALDRTTRRLSTMTFLEDIRLSMDVGDKARLLAPPTEPSPVPPARPKPRPWACPPAKAARGGRRPLGTLADRPGGQRRCPPGRPEDHVPAPEPLQPVLPRRHQPGGRRRSQEQGPDRPAQEGGRPAAARPTGGRRRRAADDHPRRARRTPGPGR